LLGELRCSTIEYSSILSQPPPTRITSPFTTVPLWKERNSTAEEYPATVERSILISTTRLLLPKLVLPPKRRREHSDPGFLTARAPSNPS
jgi:hypothetical protein